MVFNEVSYLSFAFSSSQLVKLYLPYFSTVFYAGFASGSS
jgi:hypothetical protein